MTDAPIRLALRAEGSWWVAYVARTGSMEGATEIARVRLAAVQSVVDGPDRFKALMVDVLAENLKAAGATPLSWEERSAPEIERGGSA